MNLDIILTSPLITFIFWLILIYWEGKKIENRLISVVNNIIIQEKAALKTELEAWINSETGQKAIYGIGALAGSGIMAGTGIQKKSGKFSWQNLIGEIAGDWIRKKTGFGGERKTLNSNQDREALKSA